MPDGHRTEQGLNGNDRVRGWLEDIEHDSTHIVHGREDHLQSYSSAPSHYPETGTSANPTGNALHQNETDPTAKYKKKPRHKTRSDKYKVKDTGHPTKSTGHAQKRRKLNNNHIPGNDFHARNILADRVSLKPKANLGTFSRSRISHPVAGRDLPDLTFSRIGFLSTRERLHDRATKVPCEENRDCQDPMPNQLANFMQRFAGVDPGHNNEKRSGIANSLNRTSERNSEVLIDSHLETSNASQRNARDKRVQEFLFKSQPEDNKTTVSWSMSSPRSAKYYAAQLHPNSTEPNGRLDALVSDTDRQSVDFQTSDTIDRCSSVSNQWFNMFTERLLYRKPKALAKHIDLEGRSSIDSLDPKSLAEDDSQSNLAHQLHRRSTGALADGSEMDERQPDMSERLCLPNCDPLQTLGDLTYPDKRDFKRRPAQAASATRCNSLTSGTPSIVRGTLTSQLALQKDQPRETLMDNYQDELVRPGMPPYLAHSRHNDEGLQTLYTDTDNKDRRPFSSYEYIFQDQKGPLNSALSVLPADLSLDAFDLEVLKMADKCAATPESVIRTQKPATDPGWYQSAQQPYTSRNRDVHEKSPDRCLAKPTSSIVNESIETEQLLLRPSRDRIQGHFNPFRGLQFHL